MTSSDIPATRRHRLGAALLDFFIVSLVAFIALWPLGIFEHEQAYERTQFMLRLFALLAGSYLLVNGWLLHRNGQTVGKRLVGVRIVGNANGQPLPFWILLIRIFSVLAILVNPALAWLALVDVLFIYTPQRRCLHDYLTGSTVQRVAGTGS